MRKPHPLRCAWRKIHNTGLELHGRLLFASGGSFLCTTNFETYTAITPSRSLKRSLKRSQIHHAQSAFQMHEDASARSLTRATSADHREEPSPLVAQLLLFLASRGAGCGNRLSTIRHANIHQIDNSDLAVLRPWLCCHRHWKLGEKSAVLVEAQMTIHIAV